MSKSIYFRAFRAFRCEKFLSMCGKTKRGAILADGSPRLQHYMFSTKCVASGEIICSESSWRSCRSTPPSR